MSSLTSLTSPEINTLTHLLQHLPTETPTTHAQRITSLISNLPSRSPLKRASRLSHLLGHSSSSSSPAHHHLCRLHHPLSTTLISTLFRAIALEVGPHLNTLTLHADTLTATEQETIRSLRELHSLWLAPEVYRRTFLSPPRWAYVAARCGACTVARVAGDLATLLRLRTVLLSRTSSRGGARPRRLTPYVTHWIAHLSTRLGLSGEDFERLIAANDGDAAALKATRKMLWRQRREGRRAGRAARRHEETRRGGGGSAPAGGGLEGGAGPETAEAAAASEPPASRSDNGAQQRTSVAPPGVFVVDDEVSSSSSDSAASDAEKKVFLDLTSPAYLSGISVSSTASLYERPRTYIFPVTLTTHENVNIAGDAETGKRRAAPPTRPQPTDFRKVLAGRADDSKLESLRPTTRPGDVDINIEALPSPSLYSPTSSSGDVTEQDRDRDSYIPPVFLHHTAYLPPSAADRARRYQNLLSPNPLSRGSEEELRIDCPPPKSGGDRDGLRDSEKELVLPETPDLPRRSSRRVSPPTAASGQPQPQDSCASSSISSQPRRRSRSTRSQPGSRISSIISMSANSAYSSSLKPALLSVSSSRDGEESRDGKGRVVSTFTIKEGGAEWEAEGDWHAQPRDVDVRRSQTTREVSAWGLGSNSRSESRFRAKRDLESRGGRSSAATDTTRWSDVYAYFVEDAKR